MTVRSDHPALTALAYCYPTFHRIPSATSARDA
jgi:hypothetical protein